MRENVEDVKCPGQLWLQNATDLNVQNMTKKVQRDFQLRIKNIAEYVDINKLTETNFALGITQEESECQTCTHTP